MKGKLINTRNCLRFKKEEKLLNGIGIGINLFSHFGMAEDTFLAQKSQENLGEFHFQETLSKSGLESVDSTGEIQIFRELCQERLDLTFFRFKTTWKIHEFVNAFKVL